MYLIDCLVEPSIWRTLGSEEVDGVELESEILITRAIEQDVDEAHRFLQQFVDQGFLLARTKEELRSLAITAFIARMDERVVGFSAVEIYSKKLAELQCMAVCSSVQRRGVGGRLVNQCVKLAKSEGVLELMAISASSDFLQSCGFDYSLPQQKRALFIEPQKTDPDSLK